MAFKKIPLTIDTMIRNPVPVEGINQEDNIELNIVVTENKTPKDLSSQTIKVYVRRIDGTLVEQTNQITLTNARKGEVTVKLKNSAFNKEGYALFQLDISDSNGRITSSYATFKVGKGLVSGEAIANTNEIEALKKVEEYIKKANQELETFKQTVAEINENEATRRENEVVRVREEASRNEAEAIRTQQEATRKEKENERVQAEIQRIADEEVRRENEALRGSKELERKQAEELRKEKELLRIADENNRKVAESKRIEAESVRVEAEKLRVAAETGRVRAESLRVTAEEERVAAETKREEEFNKFESKINANTKELKNARTATTGEKFNTLDERIDHEVDRLNKKIDVTMLQQEDKESHVIENTVDGMTTDMVIKGRTLNNLIVDGHTKKEIGVSTTSKAQYSYIFRLKENTKYTVIWEIEDKNDDMPYFIEISNFENKEQIKSTSKNKGIGIINTTTGSLSKLTCYYISSQVGGGRIKNVMVLEGDWTNKPIPEYFEGIKSFGEQEDKISILSNGKNLWDGTFTIGSLNAITGVETNAGENRKRSNFISIEKLNTDKITITQYDSIDSIYVHVYDENKNIIGNVYTGNSNFYPINAKLSVTLPSNAKFLRFRTENNRDLKPTSVQIEEGTQSTPYEPYKENKKDILIKEPLRSVGNISDVLYEDNGQVKINRYSKQYLITGDENIQTSSNFYTDKTLFFFFDLQNANKKTSSINICNRFPSYPTDMRGIIKNQQGEGCFIGDNNSGLVQFYINKDKLTTPDVNGFKAWLKANPTIVICQLATPVTEIVENCVDINLKTFGEKTYVSFENAISGTSSFKAPVNTVATISRLNRENRALEEENKTLRQDFESTTLSLTDSNLELVKQNVDMDFRLMEVEFALDKPQ